MTTTGEIITLALRLIRVTASEETPTAAEMNDGLKTLNQLMLGLEAQGVNLGFSALTLNDIFPLEEKFHEPIRYLLAVRLAPEYGIDLTPETAIISQQGLSILQSSFSDVPLLKMDKGLRNRRSRFGGDSGTNP